MLMVSFEEVKKVLGGLGYRFMDHGPNWETLFWRKHINNAILRIEVDTTKDRLKLRSSVAEFTISSGWVSLRYVKMADDKLINILVQLGATR